jgi:beta-lactamase class A
MTHDQLAQALLAAVRAQRFETTADSLRGGRQVAHFPSIDLAVAAFPKNGAPLFANVLFSREHTQGLVAQIDANAGTVRNIRFEADRRNASLVSDAWLPDADWQHLNFTTLHGNGPHRFVAPYPASLVKVLVAVGIARAVDARLTQWHAPCTYAQHARTTAQWCEDMIVFSCNDSTSALVALLHRLALLNTSDAPALNTVFAQHGLPTLRLNHTQADGGWGNAAGAGVGALHMTAWDSLRLMWLLDADAPPAPWLPPGHAPLVSTASRDRLRSWLDEQALHEILSSTTLAGVPGWVPGLNAQLPTRWITPSGGVCAGTEHYPPDVRPANARATLRFAHKTGTTENYASDAGIVRGIAPLTRHYLVAVLTNLGTRYAPHADCATTWRLPALGAAIDAALAPWLAP